MKFLLLLLRSPPVGSTRCGEEGTLVERTLNIRKPESKEQRKPRLQSDLLRFAVQERRRETATYGPGSGAARPWGQASRHLSVEGGLRGTVSGTVSHWLIPEEKNVHS